MHPRIIEEQSGVPLGIDAFTGETVRFDDARANPGLLARLKPLAPEEQKALTVARIQACAAWPTRVIIPDGEVDRTRALRELHAGTELVDILVRTELRVVALVIDEIQKEVRNG